MKSSRIPNLEVIKTYLRIIKYYKRVKEQIRIKEKWNLNKDINNDR